jgi:hypothetical protein
LSADSNAYAGSYADSNAYADSCSLCGEADAGLLYDHDVFHVIHFNDSWPHDDHFDCSSDAVLRVHA